MTTFTTPHKRPRVVTLGLAFALSLYTATQAATITWTGLGDGVSLFQEANWDAAGGTLSGDYIPKDTGETAHDLAINIVDNIGGGNGWNGTLDLGGVGSLTVNGATDYFRMSTSGDATLANGTAIFKKGTDDYDFQGLWSNMNVTITSGGITTAGDLTLDNGTTVNTQWMSYNNITLAGASTLNVSGNGNVFANGLINLIDADSKIVFTGGKTVAAVIADHLSGDVSDTSTSAAGRILVAGAGAIQGQNIHVYTDPQTGYTTAQRLTIPLPEYTSDGPNIIFVICDDLGYGDLGVLFQNSRSADEPKHATPKLDTMATGGMQLNSHYAAAPVCAPARASLLNGVHQGHATVRDNQFDKALGNNHSLASMLNTAGYKTAAFGKWGLQGNGTAPYWEAHPLNRGFDYFYGYIRHGDGHLHYPKEDNKEVYENYSEVSSDLDLCYTTDLFTARAKKWITDHLASDEADKPMFLYLAYDTPHAKLQYPSTAYPAGGGLSGGVQWTGTPGAMINTSTGIYDGYIHPDYATATYDHDSNPGTAEIAWPDMSKRWAGGVRRVDDAMGDLLTLLDDLNIANNTLVVFTSDNGVTKESYYAESFEPGFFDSFGPFDGIKRDTWEGGIRVPTFAYWPGTITSGSISNTPSAFWDWMPTFAELAGQPVPTVTDGTSLVPELKDTGSREDSTIYVEYYQNGSTPNYPEFEVDHQGRSRNQMQVIQIEGYKGIRYNITSHSDNFEIYDVINDPKETTNLATHSQFVSMQQRMKDLVLQLRRPNSTAARPYDNEVVPAAVVLDSFTTSQTNYAVFEGEWAWLPDFATMTPTASGTLANVDLSVAPAVAKYGIQFSGYLDIPTTGEYTFYLTSDSGSSLRIHDALVIDDDYTYTGAEVSGTIQLAAGKHPYTLSYRNAGRTAALNFQYEGPGISKQTVPSARFALPSGTPETVSNNSLLDDPNWIADPIGVTGAADQWNWSNPGITWETSSANTGSVEDSFTAGSVTLSSHYNIFAHPMYDAQKLRIKGLVPNWNAADFTYASTENYDPLHILNGWYTVTLTTADGSFTATSALGKLHDGPTRQTQDDSTLQANLATAWNTSLTWDTNPFASGGLLLSEVLSIQVTFYASTSAGNSAASGSSFLTLNNSSILMSADFRDAYNAWSEDNNIPETPSADNDQDSLSALIEYAFNLNPNSADYKQLTPASGKSGLPHLEVDDNNQRLRVEFVRRRNDPNLTYSVEFSNDLQSTSWNSPQISSDVTAIDPVWERVVVHDAQTTSESPNRFGRVKVLQN
jgi:arylsulfatase A-like enzyme